MNISAQNVHRSIVPFKIGDKAPPLKIAKWIKGNEFKKGQIYIVEFGFITCAPCRVSISILSAISHRCAGGVSVLGVHIWENDKNKPSDLAYIDNVDDFIRVMGNKINYTIGVDVPEQTTANTWGGGRPKPLLSTARGC